MPKPSSSSLYEMEAVRQDDESSDQVNSPYTSYANGVYGEAEAFPRVGDEYQAEIPDLMSEDDHFKLISSSESDPFSLCLPIPLMWTRSEIFKGFCETMQKDDPLPTGGSIAERSIVLALPSQRNVKFKYEWLDKSLYPFPGCLGQAWEDVEQKRFLLGLYCLGKNLVFVQRFVGSKKMGDVLSYYYGEFYRSSEYKRWADGRSLRSRRSVQGHKLFSGWRQQELLSRISSRVSEESMNTLLEVSKAFREEKMELAAYVLAMKDEVGTDVLIEAIGVGKGKKDLTNGALEPPKTTATRNSEVPMGRACSSLSPTDIVRYLTGGFRLSKTRSSDLFWEAVWPRLLARGWHSEQPRDHARNSLVFLIPGANRFSRRKMVKGNHYFDSVTDVLNRVASDPSILELETEAVGDENAQLMNSDEFDDSSPCSKRQRYLQPHKASKSRDAMMFTIVDTSTSHGVERCVVRDTRCLPLDAIGSSIVSPSCFDQSEDSSSEESEHEADKKAKATATRDRGTSSVHTNGDSLDPKGCLSIGGKRRSSFNGGMDDSGETLSRKKKPKSKARQGRPKPRQDTRQDEVVREENRDEAQKLQSSVSSSCERTSLQRDDDVSRENPKTHQNFDLNITQTSWDPQVETIVAIDNSESSCPEQSSSSMQNEPPNSEVGNDQNHGLRQSRRSRPLTARALEAFASGFLGSPKKKRKDPAGSRNRSRPKSIKLTADHTVVTAEFRNGTVDDVQIAEKLDRS